jgi:hypothetical protein
MGKTLQYVKDFDFKSAGKTVGLCKGGPVKYAKGGAVTEKATGEKYPSGSAMIKHERTETPRMQREELIERVKTNVPAPRKGVPVASSQPLIAMKKGGAVSKGEMKMGKVMSEYKHGELHSGSKTGPLVTNRKQAVAIAMSEARKASKK